MCSEGKGHSIVSKEEKKGCDYAKQIHKAVFVETEQVDKIEKSELFTTLVDGWGGGVDLSNQLLNYFLLLQKKYKMVINMQKHQLQIYKS